MRGFFSNTKGTTKAPDAAFLFVSISALRNEEMVKFMSSYRTSVAATGRPLKWIRANAATPT